jgi:hypothetical protein
MILKLKHWQVFIVLMTFMVLYYLTADSKFGTDNFSSIELRTTFGVIGQIVFFTWVLLLGLSLNRIKENPHHFSKVLLIISVLCCILGYGDLQLRALSSDSSSINETISLILSPLTFLGIIYTFKNVSQSLKSIETGEKAKFKDYILDAILIFMFPIGIWFIQPRLNRIYKVTETTKDER